MADRGAPSQPPATAGGQEGDPGAVENVEDLTGFVQTLLTQMQDKFQHMSDAILGKLDEMTARVDELEAQVGNLVKESKADLGKLDEDEKK
ncbi:heat shock factor-binding protein 1-like [Sycon ciliatum]|uniref:heat shock factor-binding protein 1-like n=1 Tax=Sycon ciliatum TaxID=27933 RepID=UPI0020AD4AEF